LNDGHVRAATVDVQDGAVNEQSPVAREKYAYV
jgi:hypothetical protein